LLRILHRAALSADLGVSEGERVVARQDADAAFRALASSGVTFRIPADIAPHLYILPGVAGGKLPDYLHRVSLHRRSLRADGRGLHAARSRCATLGRRPGAVAALPQAVQPVAPHAVVDDMQRIESALKALYTAVTAVDEHMGAALNAIPPAAPAADPPGFEDLSQLQAVLHAAVDADYMVEEGGGRSALIVLPTAEFLSAACRPAVGDAAVQLMRCALAASLNMVELSPEVAYALPHLAAAVYALQAAVHGGGGQAYVARASGLVAALLADLAPRYAEFPRASQLYTLISPAVQLLQPSPAAGAPTEARRSLQGALDATTTAAKPGGAHGSHRDRHDSQQPPQRRASGGQAVGDGAAGQARVRGPGAAGQPRGLSHDALPGLAPRSGSVAGSPAGGGDGEADPGAPAAPAPAHGGAQGAAADGGKGPKRVAAGEAASPASAPLQQRRHTGDAQGGAPAASIEAVADDHGGAPPGHAAAAAAGAAAQRKRLAEASPQNDSGVPRERKYVRPVVEEEEEEGGDGGGDGDDGGDAQQLRRSERLRGGTRQVYADDADEDEGEGSEGAGPSSPSCIAGSDDSGDGDDASTDEQAGAARRGGAPRPASSSVLFPRISAVLNRNGWLNW
jgi:hypothetical protein